MCKIGDIILVNPLKGYGKDIGKHSFVVIDDNDGEIRGLEFNMVGLIMSSMDTEEKRKRLMKYPANLPLTSDEQIIEGGGNHKDACVKADQFYYFNKSTCKYRVLENLDSDVFNLLIEFIEELSDKGLRFKTVIDNL